MHPALCERVSQLSYEGRLHSEETVTTARRLAGLGPGVHVEIVEHDGRSTDSPEESAAIVARIRELLGRAWTDPSDFAGTRPLGQADVLVVAPFNAQVARLRQDLAAAGLPDVLVGTVDKFQGRQAAVVLVSMTASTATDAPRGMSFLLSRNRLNVAVSRAKWCAIVVRRARSPTTCRPPPPPSPNWAPSCDWRPSRRGPRPRVTGSAEAHSFAAVGRGRRGAPVLVHEVNLGEALAQLAGFACRNHTRPRRRVRLRRRPSPGSAPRRRPRCAATSIRSATPAPVRASSPRDPTRCSRRRTAW